MNAITIRTAAVKICGLSTLETVDAALEAGADMIGLVLHPKSPRFVTDARAAGLAAHARRAAPHVKIVALVVDLDDGRIDEIGRLAAPDLFQCHGAESAARLSEIRRLTAKPVIKAVGLASPSDLTGIEGARSADLILIDAKPPKDAAYPGGHGRPFDWALLQGFDPNLPFMLSGGLTAENVGEAVLMVRGFGLNLAGVDVSSGVESAPGVKDPDKIKAFVAAARAAMSGVTR